MKFFLGEQEFDVFEGVYPPSEDSYLLSESIEINPQDVALDIGCGSGIQTITMALQGATVFAVDILQKALDNTLHNAKIAGIKNQVFAENSDLFSNIKKDMKFDLIVFNPPYVPSEKEKKYKDLDGGIKGQEVLHKFLDKFSLHLKENGKTFFLQSSLNDVEKTSSILTEKGLNFEIVNRQNLFMEELIVFKAFF